MIFAPISGVKKTYRRDDFTILQSTFSLLYNASKRRYFYNDPRCQKYLSFLIFYDFTMIFLNEIEYPRYPNFLGGEGVIEKVHLYLTSWKSDIDRLSMLIPDLSISSLNSNFLQNMVSRAFFSQKLRENGNTLHVFRQGFTDDIEKVRMPPRLLLWTGCSDMGYKNGFIFALSFQW